MTADTDAPGDDERAALDLLAGRGLVSLVWLDAGLDVTKCYGDVGRWVKPGLPISASLPVFLGLEDDLRALGTDGNDMLVLPNVGVGEWAGRDAKITLEVLARRGGYLVSIRRIDGQSQLESELARQVRARRLAEQELRRAEAALVANARELDRANRELRRVNADLDSFTHVITHDLKAPLRAMRFTLEWIMNEVEDKQLDIDTANLTRLSDQARRMSAMVTGLLAYSHAGQKSDLVETVDLGAMVADIAENLSPGSGIVIRHDGDWPVIDAVREPLDIVLRNLVSNALKHHDRQTGTVELSLLTAGEYWCVAVRDDGPGIAPEHHEAIFRPFCRLGRPSGDEQDDAPSGLGLAMVKKLVELHGGMIEVNSEPDRKRGTEFLLFWPKGERQRLDA